MPYSSLFYVINVLMCSYRSSFRKCWHNFNFLVTCDIIYYICTYIFIIFLCLVVYMFWASFTISNAFEYSCNKGNMFCSWSFCSFAYFDTFYNWAQILLVIDAGKNDMFVNCGSVYLIVDGNTSKYSLY